MLRKEDEEQHSAQTKNNTLPCADAALALASPLGVGTLLVLVLPHCCCGSRNGTRKNEEVGREIINVHEGRTE